MENKKDKSFADIELRLENIENELSELWSYINVLIVRYTDLLDDSKTIISDHADNYKEVK